MPHTYASLLVHVVFSTKDRTRWITPAFCGRLSAFLGGVARNHGMGLLAAGGANDHVHLLVRVPTTVTIAKCVQSIKAVSSKWVHETFSNFAGFAWQEGYGAFSVGISQVDETVAYIESQEEHHRRHTFEEELISFLKKHDIEYDPRFVFG